MRTTDAGHHQNGGQQYQHSEDNAGYFHPAWRPGIRRLIDHLE
ncbi:hypothetical protein ABIA27_004024 [Sinorhizobium fredii]